MPFIQKLINKHTISLASNAIMPVLGMAILALMARYLVTPGDFGDYIFFLVLFTLADTFRTGFLQTALIKYYAGTSPERSANVAGSAWCVGLMIILGFAIGNLIVYLFCFGASQNMMMILKWFSIIFLSTLPTAIAGWILQAEERFDKLFLVQLINQGGFFVFILLLIILHRATFQNVIYCYFLNNLISSIVTTSLGWSRIKTIGSKSWSSIKELAHFGKFSVGTSISSYLLRSSDTFIIKMMFPSSLLGVYYIPQRLMEIFEIPLRAFIATALPTMSAAVHRDDKKYVSYIMKKYAGMLTIALIPVAIGAFLLADLVIGLLFGKTYQHSDAGNIFRIFMCFVMLLPIDRFFGITLDIIGKPQLNMVKVFIMLTVNVIGDFAGIFIFHNLYGVAIASIFTFFSGAIFGYWSLKKHLNFSVKDIFYLGYIELTELITMLYNKVRKKETGQF
ncbi:oligosaccharide flippase family protein [Mucilaginibacter ginsenosidivorax]|uniref:Oligosaccharide flippase family protein n=1 Tax=Mucilaginibacter ginsenosidivorax TaxID=862126 RepID=A0A5B8VSU6_9SPHI|nr:oligosaccharide flippase family protein [Mucilaginibacter ginsenosidivorax]QEC74510.1 oligosaccharide flippase family protein [Mucilaginibacter ginsenosidivorax]